MTRIATAHAALVAIVCAMAISGSARADSSAIGVQYRAPSECPSDGEFFAEARQRNSRVGAPSPGTPTQLLVTIARAISGRYAGRLERVTASGTVGMREIDGESCREVATALALITAVTGDLVPSVPVAAPVPSPAAPSAITVDAGSADPRVGAAPSDAGATPVRAADAQGVGRLRWQVGLNGVAASGLTQGLMLGGGAFLQASARTSATWAPSARLALSFARASWASTIPGSDAQADFTWAKASVDACPLQVGDPLALSAQPCARFAAGRLAVSGSTRGTAPANEASLWLDVGALARGHWQVSHAAFVDVEAEMFFPLERREFQFGPEVVYTQPRVALHLAAGMGLVFR